MESNPDSHNSQGDTSNIIRPIYYNTKPLLSIKAFRKPVHRLKSNQSSRQVVDKIMREGESLIPIHSRAEYNIICEDLSTGRQYQKKI